MNNTWGGSRPKQRDDDKRGGAREGAGRPRRMWDSGGPGGHWVVERYTMGSLNSLRHETWQVLDVNADGTIDFQCGKDVITLRLPE